MDYFFTFWQSPNALIVPCNSAIIVTSPVNASVANCIDISNEFVTFDLLGFSRRCADSNFGELQPRKFENAIMDSSHTFPKVQIFEMLCILALARRFRYSFMRNSTNAVAQC